MIGALVAAVAGGTYAIFTDTAGSQDATFEAGTVAIEIDVDTAWYEDEFPLNLSMSTMEAGDENQTEISIHNTGSLPVWLQMYVFQTHGDPVDLWTCDSDLCSLQYEIIADADWNLDPSDIKYVTVRVWLPLCAGNSCQGGSADLRILFVAKQKSHIEGIYDCVALENKDADWVPILSDGIEGEVCYKVGSPLDIVVNAYGLNVSSEYQVTLNGPGDCTPGDLGIGDTPPSMNYKRGFFNILNQLETTCDNVSDGSAGEGVWNFGPNDPMGSVTSNADGSLSYQASLSLDDATYSNVKFLIKEATDPWQTILMETEQLNFTIP